MVSRSPLPCPTLSFSSSHPFLFTRGNKDFIDAINLPLRSPWTTYRSSSGRRISRMDLIAVILGHIWCSEHPQMRARIELLLKQQKLTKENIKDILQEYHENFGDLDGPEEKERAQTRIQKFITAFS